MTFAVANGTWVGRAPHQVGTRLLGLACLFGAFLALTGALDTQAAPTPARLLFWTSISTVGAFALEGAYLLLRRQWPRGDGRLTRAIAVALVILPLTLAATISCKLLFGGRPSAEGFVLLLPGMTGILSGLQLILATFVPATERAGRETSREEGVPRQPNPATLPLPLPLRGARIEAIQAEDHYVRVYTSAGHALLRMRFRDALSAVVALDGIRPHRSWWVARGSIVSLARHEGRSTLTLESGMRVPVSRGYRPALGPAFRRHI